MELQYMLLFACLVSLYNDCVSAWEMTLLHVNDMHARIEETNKYSSECPQQNKQDKKCFGGMARLHSIVEDIMRREENVVWLNAGDLFQGTIWYTYFKWRVAAKFNALLNFDAMTLGNHEFDDGIEGLLPFLQNKTTEVVVANLDATDVPVMQGLYTPYIKIEKGGRTIGIIGYITPETKDVAFTGDLIITDEVEAVRKYAKELHDDGVDIIIALGHSGYDKDLKVAEVPFVDIVVGGHSHSFLFTGDRSKRKPEKNKYDGEYPTVVDIGDRKVLVVQAYAYTKYLGRLKITFNDEGEIESWSGEPILLDHHYDKDTEFVEEIVPMKHELDDYGKQNIGDIGELLYHSRARESSLGNFITDAMVWAWSNKTQGQGTFRLAIENSGGIRVSLNPGEINLKQLLTVLPFQSTFDMVTLKGKTLKKALEHSVSKCQEDDPQSCDGQFLQLSSDFRVVFDLSRPPYSRITDAKVKCHGNCSCEYCNIWDNADYNVVISDYIAGGSDGFDMIKDEALHHLQGALDTDIMKKYIETNSPVVKHIEGRISFGCCWRVMLNTTGPSERTQGDRLGEYRIHGTGEEVRGSYKHVDREEFMFYKDFKGEVGLWVVGPTRGTFMGGIGRQGKNGSCVNQAKGEGWLFYRPRQRDWEVDENLAATCF